MSVRSASTVRTKRESEVPPPAAITSEPVNVQALQEIASRRAANTTLLRNCDVTLRTVIFDVLRCVVPLPVPHLRVTWREDENAQSYGYKARRFSGFGPFAGSRSPYLRTLQALYDKGGGGMVGRSLFSLPKLIRYAGRCGMEGRAMDIDQVNSHFFQQLKRHPDAKCLHEYVTKREKQLEAVGVSPEAAKILFLRLGYGGSVAKWKEEEHIERELPEFVSKFYEEQRQLRNEDCERHPDLFAAIKLSGHPRPDVYLQSLLNMAGERQALDEMQEAVEQGGLVGSFEHDGLFVWQNGNDPGWEGRTLARVTKKVGAPVAKKPIPSLDRVVELLRASFPGDWDSVDPDWNCQLSMIQMAKKFAARAQEHKLYANIVAVETQAFREYPWSVKELFVHEKNGNYHFYDPSVNRWVDPEAGQNRLIHVITDTLLSRLCDWSPYEPDEIGEESAAVRDRDDRIPLFNSVDPAKSTEKFLRALLSEHHFELDGEATRRYIQFENCVFDRESMRFVPHSPALRITNSTGWSYHGSGLSEDVERRLSEVLSECNRPEFSQDTVRELESLAKEVPDLWFVYSICGTWERALYCLKHIARATFALKYQENLWSRGPGGNGKDTLANRVATLLGSYFVNLPCEALTAFREVDAPSQTFLSLRAKRFVCVREIARGEKIKGNVYKTISDPKGKVKARGLFGKDQEFHPHFLMFLCSNVPIEIDDKSGGTTRRTRILDMPYNFVDAPDAANEKQKDPSIEDRFEEWNPSMFFLLMQLYERLLKDSRSSTVVPVPEEVAEAGSEELREPWMDKLDEWTRARVRPTDSVKDAATAATVRESFFEALVGELQKREVGMRLAQKGFHESPPKPYKDKLKTISKRLYSFKFEDGTHYVALAD